MSPRKSAKVAASVVRAPKKNSLDDDVRLAKLREIVKMLETSSLAELHYEDEEIAVEVRRYGAAQPQSIATAPHAFSAPQAIEVRPASNIAPAPVPDVDLHVVRSPFVGTFYASPSPGAERFSEVGKQVRRGQTICIIEAMKLMNEIESEVDGVVTEVLAENGKTVQYGDALFRIKISR